MFFQRLAFLLAILPICTFAPGFVLARKLRWKPAETLCASVALSLVLIYGFAFVGYLADLAPAFYYVASGISLAVLILYRKDVTRLFGNAHVRGIVRWFAILVMWTMLLMLLIRNFSGGTWSGDWLEHYDRSRFFLRAEGFDKETLFIKQYPLPARPPMMNVVAAFFMRQVGADFECFQVTFGFLSVLPFLACAVMLDALVRRGRRGGGLVALAVLLAANPMFVQNAMYPWTKLLTAFFVIFGLWLYLRGLRKQDSTRIVGAFGCLLAACLVHYSAGPYALFLGLHFVVFGLRSRKRPGIELAAIAGVACVLMGTWFTWSLVNYGARKTFASNTSVTASNELSVTDNLTKVGENIWYTLAPFPLREPGMFTEPYHPGVPAASPFTQPSTAGRVRDAAFMFYQHNLIFAFGSVGWIALGYLLIGHVTRSRVWWSFILFTALVGIAAHGSVDPHGVAHICLQPLVLLGVTFIAAAWRVMPRWLRGVVLTGVVLDFCVGILLHFHLQNRVVELVELSEETFTVNATPELLAKSAEYNFFASTMTFLGDSFSYYAIGIEIIVVLMFAAMLRRLVKLPKESRKVRQVHTNAKRGNTAAPG